MQRLLLASALAFGATASVASAQQADLAPPYTGAPTYISAPVLSQKHTAGSDFLNLARAGGLLFDQSDLVTSEGTGAGGADESALQSSIGLNTYGAGHNQAGAVFVADDFTVPEGATWTVNEFVFYGYQTGATIGASTFTGYYVQIYDGPPNDPGSTVIAGDLTTNIISASDFSGIYRVLDTDAPGTAVSRPIFMNTATLPASVELEAGTYWVAWGATGSLPSGPWTPPVTIVGQAITGNAQQQLSGVWNPLLDGGAEQAPQGLPFQVYGTSTGGPPPTVLTFPSTDTPIPVPDGPAGGTVCGDPGAPAVSTIAVAGTSGTVVDLDLLIDISATWVGDVEATLSHGGTSAIVIDNPGATTPTACGNGADNIPGVILDDAATNSIQTGPFPLVAGASYTPANPLSAFNGALINGDWTLSVTDGGEGDDTALNGWSLLVTPSGGVAGEEGASALTRLTVSPNPVATQGQVSLTVATTQDVRVALYDALGREVRVLLDRTMTAGQQAHLGFTTRDLPAGVYVVRATGSDLSLTQQVTVVR